MFWIHRILCFESTEFCVLNPENFAFRIHRILRLESTEFCVLNPQNFAFWITENFAFKMLRILSFNSWNSELSILKVSNSHVTCSHVYVIRTRYRTEHVTLQINEFIQWIPFLSKSSSLNSKREISSHHSHLKQHLSSSKCWFQSPTDKPKLLKIKIETAIRKAHFQKTNLNQEYRRYQRECIIAQKERNGPPCEYRPKADFLKIVC